MGFWRLVSLKKAQGAMTFSQLRISIMSVIAGKSNAKIMDVEGSCRRSFCLFLANSRRIKAGQVKPLFDKADGEERSAGSSYIFHKPCG